MTAPGCRDKGQRPSPGAGRHRSGRAGRRQRRFYHPYDHRRRIKVRAILSMISNLPALNRGRLGGQRTRSAATLSASAIRRRAGRKPGGWWPRSSGIQASFTRASASSPPTWCGRPSAWWLLQPARHGGAMDQERDGRGHVALAQLRAQAAGQSHPGWASEGCCSEDRPHPDRPATP
jgi:hypothetical protein